MHIYTLLFLLVHLICLQGCSSTDDQEYYEAKSSYKDSNKNFFQHGEFISRTSKQSMLQIPESNQKTREYYPWEEQTMGQQQRITKEFFRCKGNSSNPVRIVQEEKGPERHSDCGGNLRHSLPLREGKEFIYPILPNLLNYIQKKSGMRVVITSGHRCPEHNTYVDPSSKNRYSKHQIGAEVAFYVQGLEHRPEVVLNYIQSYYKEMPQYGNNKEYIEFQRYEKSDTDVSTQPWYNKEVFVKIYQANEGRNGDVRHPYAYLSIQVRFDRDKNEKVTYSWDQAYKNYHRF